VGGPDRGDHRAVGAGFPAEAGGDGTGQLDLSWRCFQQRACMENTTTRLRIAVDGHPSADGVIPRRAESMVFTAAPGIANRIGVVGSLASHGTRRRAVRADVIEKKSPRSRYGCVGYRGGGALP